MEPMMLKERHVTMQCPAMPQFLTYHLDSLAILRPCFPQLAR